VIRNKTIYIKKVLLDIFNGLIDKKCQNKDVYQAFLRLIQQNVGGDKANFTQSSEVYKRLKQQNPVVLKDDDFKHFAKVIQAAKSHGVRVCLNGFGACLRIVQYAQVPTCCQ